MVGGGDIDRCAKSLLPRDVAKQDCIHAYACVRDNALFDLFFPEVVFSVFSFSLYRGILSIIGNGQQKGY